jgi:hypothetical protein
LSIGDEPRTIKTGLRCECSTGFLLTLGNLYPLHA